VPDASKFRVFGCAISAKVPDKLRRKLSEKAFRGVMVGYPTDALGYRVYNPETRRITTSVHVVFQENTPGFGTRLPLTQSSRTIRMTIPSRHLTTIPPYRHPTVRSSTPSYSPLSCSSPVALPPLRGSCGPHVRIPADTCHNVL
jgi:hypothetical protein